VGHVIYLSTFSKILFPGIRPGWLVAPRPVVGRSASVKQYADLHSNTPAQNEQGIREGIRRLSEALTALMRSRQEHLVPRQEAVRPIV
jgi:DNA-binding transcriptional MocR family regulator